MSSLCALPLNPSHPVFVPCWVQRQGMKGAKTACKRCKGWAQRLGTENMKDTSTDTFFGISTHTSLDMSTDAFLDMWCLWMCPFMLFAPSLYTLYALDTSVDMFTAALDTSVDTSGVAVDTSTAALDTFTETSTAVVDESPCETFTTWYLHLCPTLNLVKIWTQVQK